MKFKSNVKVTQEAPVNFEDLMQDMDNVLNMELEEAVEHLEDLTILEQNISKYGVTEPVMHLVGGTLESMSISIADKESCLEGLKEGLKEAGKKVWEVIVKIYEKIRDYVKGFIAKFNKEKFDELEDKFKGEKVNTNELDATDLIPYKYIKYIIDFANDAEHDVGHDAEAWARAYPELLVVHDTYGVHINAKFDKEVIESKFSSKGYSDLSMMFAVSSQLIDAMGKIEKAAEFCIKQSNIYLKLHENGQANSKLYKGYRDTGKAISKLIPYCLRSATVANNIGKQAAKSGVKQQ